MFDLKEKVCLVTGASRGIGFALIKAFLKRGAFCLMVDVDYKVRLSLVVLYLLNCLRIIDITRREKRMPSYSKKNMATLKFIS